MSVKLGRLGEPMVRGREWYIEAWKIAEGAAVTDDQIATIAKQWHYLDSPYLSIERGDGEHKTWPKITPEVFALISACLLIQRAEEMQATDRAGQLSDIDTAIGLFWLCRFAWNMSKAKVTPAAARAALRKASRHAQILSVDARNANSGKEEAERNYKRMRKANTSRPAMIERIMGLGVPKSTAYRWIAEWEKNSQ